MTEGEENALKLTISNLITMSRQMTAAVQAAAETIVKMEGRIRTLEMARQAKPAIIDMLGARVN